MIYSAGNFIEATADTPYLQIGEHKYGKPILDRSVTDETELYDALKLGLISMDSTIRSNLGVGMPIDLAVIRRDALAFDLTYRIDSLRTVLPRSPRALVVGACAPPTSPFPARLTATRSNSRFPAARPWPFGRFGRRPPIRYGKRTKI